MMIFNIAPLDQALASALQRKIDNLTKPKGSLGHLESLALQLGLIQNSLSPQLNKPHHIVFASDHGIVAENVSPAKQEVTYQMVMNFLAGGASINFLARQHKIALKIVDAGVNFDFDPSLPIIARKIRKSTRNFLYEAAMTYEEMNQAIKEGSNVTQTCFDEGCNIVSFGEMGIGNTSPTSMWITKLAGIPLEACVNPGAGLNEAGVQHKLKVLQAALDHYSGSDDPIEIMQYFGGYELVMAVGAMLKAAELKMAIVIDGIIMHAALLMAMQFYPEVRDYAIFGHCGPEPEHKALLEMMEGVPILQLNLRLGEGSGAVCAYPIIESSVRMINEMSSFDNVNVTKVIE